MKAQYLVTLIFASLTHVAIVHAAPALDDATILAIFDEANGTDIWVGRIGIKQAQSAAVRDLAKMVVADHQAVQQMGRELANRLAVSPTPPRDDQSAAQLADAVARLQVQSPAAFDQAYLQHEIAFHQAVIDAVKTTLLPAASHAELKALLQKTLPGFEHHLAQTKTVAAKLGMAP